MTSLVNHSYASRIPYLSDSWDMSLVMILAYTRMLLYKIFQWSVRVRKVYYGMGVSQAGSSGVQGWGNGGNPYEPSGMDFGWQSGPGRSWWSAFPLSFCWSTSWFAHLSLSLSPSPTFHLGQYLVLIWYCTTIKWMLPPSSSPSRTTPLLFALLAFINPPFLPLQVKELVSFDELILSNRFWVYGIKRRPYHSF